MFNRVNLQSFDIAILEEVYIQSPRMRVALLVDDNESISTKLNIISFMPEIISPYYKLLTAEAVDSYQKQDFLIIPWTINKEEDLKRMLAWNVDGIITDYPNRLIEIIKERSC